MAQDRGRRVYIILHQDNSIINVLGVFEDVQDANTECLRHAAQAGIDLVGESSSTGPNQGNISPVELVRWDTPEGVSCWVESHTVEARLETRLVEVDG